MKACPNPAYPSDFIGELELFQYIEHPSGEREEQWLTDTRLIRCIWFKSNDGAIPNTMYYEYF